MAESQPSFSEQVHKLIECCVCYSIPRELPISGCASGHVLCQQCRWKVLSCPLCRRRVSGGFNNVVLGQIAEIAMHKCIFESFGCSYQTTMTKIQQHESECIYKVVRCPFFPCGQEVQMTKYEQHAKDFGCAVDLGKNLIFNSTLKL